MSKAERLSENRAKTNEENASRTEKVLTVPCSELDVLGLLIAAERLPELQDVDLGDDILD